MENSRIIKFRAWDKDNKTMILPEYSDWEDFFIEPDGSASRSYETGVWDLYRRKVSVNFDLMQYTGLKDKNGVEIYEGDVIKSDDYNEPIFYISIEDYPEEIDYCSNDENKKNIHEFIHDVIYSESHSNLLRTSRNKIEVIGNIYENPELCNQ